MDNLNKFLLIIKNFVENTLAIEKTNFPKPLTIGYHETPKGPKIFDKYFFVNDKKIEYSKLSDLRYKHTLPPNLTDSITAYDLIFRLVFNDGPPITIQRTYSKYKEFRYKTTLKYSPKLKFFGLDFLFYGKSAETVDATYYYQYLEPQYFIKCGEIKCDITEKMFQDLYYLITKQETELQLRNNNLMITKSQEIINKRYEQLTKKTFDWTQIPIIPPSNRFPTKGAL